MTPNTQQTRDGYTFRDLNKNGRLDPYEDPRRPLEDRVDDLLGQMQLAEKVGMLFHTMLPMNEDGSLVEGQSRLGPFSTADLVQERLINHFNLMGGATPRAMANWHNRLQRMAEGTRLGIPITLSSDPRHAFSDNPLTHFHAGAFSQWPEPPGLAATRDPALIKQFADIARQEYLAVGIRVALHPMADLATEPRWARSNGTFGEDAELAAQMVAAYIRGFQGESLGASSVACMTKHFPGGGPQKDGEDSHFPYGREQIYPGSRFDYHLIPFEAAFAAGTAQIMPYYSLPVSITWAGKAVEEVGFAFNRDVITNMLREHYGFDGVVCSDWGLLTDAEIQGQPFPARAWGVEHLSRSERTKKVLDAGVDQFGGEKCTEVILALVQSGQVDEARLDQSIRRLLRDKFRLGLFDNPYVDPDAAETIVGQAGFVAAGKAAQRRSLVLLKNGQEPGGLTLPVPGRPTLYVENIAPEVANAYGQVVDSPAEADLAILRVQAPYQAREGNLLERLFHAGDLDVKEPEKSRILNILAQTPTIVDIYLDRPAVIPEIAAQSAALVANFGAEADAVLDLIFGRCTPAGKLPFELPSSMDAVRNQYEDVPYDSQDPLFRFGHGLMYDAETSAHHSSMR